VAPLEPGNKPLVPPGEPVEPEVAPDDELPDDPALEPGASVVVLVVPELVPPGEVVVVVLEVDPDGAVVVLVVVEVEPVELVAGPFVEFEEPVPEDPKACSKASSAFGY
jgi:hypothetical protein